MEAPGGHEVKQLLHVEHIFVAYVSSSDVAQQCTLCDLFYLIDQFPAPIPIDRRCLENRRPDCRGRCGDLSRLPDGWLIAGHRGHDAGIPAVNDPLSLHGRRSDHLTRPFLMK